MPSFTQYDVGIDVEIDIDVKEFYEKMSEKECKEMYALLSDQYHKVSGLNASEHEYEKALSQLRGKWNRLTAEEEQTILNIAKRF